MRGRYHGGQNGSLAGFIIVGVLLALVLVGGLYGLNRYNAQKAADKTTVSKQDKKTTTDIPKDSEPAAKKDEANSGSSNGTGTSGSTAPATSTDQDTQSSALPKTGPSDAFTSLVLVTLLSFAAAHVVQSRRVRT